MKEYNEKVFNYSHQIVRVCLIIFLAFGALISVGARNTFKLLTNAWRYDYLLPFIWLYVLLALIMYFLYKHIIDYSWKKIFGIIFITSFLPRILVNLLSLYTPTSDFSNYLLLGKLFLEGDFNQIQQICSSYNIATFGGLAVLNGLIGGIFSPTVIGFQIANSVITALISGIIYLIGRIHSNKVGVIAALLYAFYPSNIISTQITTNQHGATLLYLSSIYLLIMCLQEKEGYSIYKLIGSSFLFVGAYFFHPSGITHVIAIVIYGGLLVIKHFNNKKYRTNIMSSCLSFIIGVIAIYTVSLTLLDTTGIIDRNANELSMLSKIAVGLNLETRGQYSDEDYSQIVGRTKEEQNKIATQLILERVKNSREIPKLFFDKLDYMWFQGDSTFYWYKVGEQITLAENNVSDTIVNKRNKVIDAYSQLDVIYCFIIYTFALLALILPNKFNSMESIYLLLWVLAGWVGVHLFIEVQSRYRYFGMPIVFILSAIGISQVLKRFKS